MVQTACRTKEIPVDGHGGRCPVLLVVHVPGHLHPCRGAEACSHGLDCSSDHEIPQLLDMVIDVPVVLVVQDIPVVMQSLISMSR